MILLTLLAADGNPFAILFILGAITLMIWSVAYSVWQRRRQALQRRKNRNRRKRRNRAARAF